MVANRKQKTDVVARPEMMPELFRITRIKKETHDTFTFDLKPSRDGFKFVPGQFNMLYLFGIGEIPISISGHPADDKKLVHTIRAVGNITKNMKKLKKGDFLGVRGPFGSKWPLGESIGYDIVIVAGGIGLAPLRPSIYHLLAHREKYGNIVLLYGTRTPADILYRTEIESWRSRFDVEVLLTVDHATSEWRGIVGVVTTLISRAHFDSFNTIAMICGPEIMMRFTIQELQKNGISLENIYLSMERNMKCGVGFCGHCQYGPTFICKDGPIFSYPTVKNLLLKREI